MDEITASGALKLSREAQNFFLSPEAVENERIKFKKHCLKMITFCAEKGEESAQCTFQFAQKYFYTIFDPVIELLSSPPYNYKIVKGNPYIDSGLIVCNFKFYWNE